jgi:uncharacterized protein (TIGR02757 family)
MDVIYIKEYLDQFETNFNKNEIRKNDPVDILWDYPLVEDKEIVALISSCLAYGRVQLLKKAIRSSLQIMGDSPYHFMKNYDIEETRKLMKEFKYRMCTGEDMVQLFAAISYALKEYGSIKNMFIFYDDPSRADLQEALTGSVHALRRFSGSTQPGFLHMLPDPALGGACKRLNLMLRWLIRGPDEVDPGIWKEFSTSRLTIPLDTHIQRITKYIGISTRKTPDWRAAREITDNLLKICPEDPLKYDFVICHLGISGECPQKRDLRICLKCQLQPICQL